MDADRLARRHLRQLLEDEPDVALVAECDAGSPAIEVIALARPDLVFLDVTLPDIDGFALGARLRSHVPGGLVYVSDRPQGALQAFDVHALGYLLKPVGRERLRAAVAHARSILLQDRRGIAEERLLALLDQRDAERQRRARLLIRHADGAFFLRTQTIDWIEAADQAGEGAQGDQRRANDNGHGCLLSTPRSGSRPRAEEGDATCGGPAGWR
ncbi:MAG: LytR/AlgR family response regulator transcription factor [Gemmatimonadales bacterium]